MTQFALRKVFAVIVVFILEPKVEKLLDVPANVVGSCHRRVVGASLRIYGKRRLLDWYMHIWPTSLVVGWLEGNGCENFIA